MTEAKDNVLHGKSAPGQKKAIAVVLGGGGACGLAHIGVLQVLEEEDVDIQCIVGTSMGGLVGALSAVGLRAQQIRELARGFRFPRSFLLGRVVTWDSVFRPAVAVLRGSTFSGLRFSLLLTTTDLEAGAQIVLRRGALLPSVRASCAVPGILPPENIEGRWLVDGSLVNQLPVDVAWMVDPDLIVAVNVGVTRPRRIAALHRNLTPAFMQLGQLVPNPATARVSFEILARAAEITVARQAALATAMAGPDLLVEPRLSNLGLADFDRLEEAVEAGRCAAQEAMPALRQLLAEQASRPTQLRATSSTQVDLVCGMLINAVRARATATHGGDIYHFCSLNCRDLFERDPRRYIPMQNSAGKSLETSDLEGDQEA